MVNEEILGGLKLALYKGESLKQAMMSFYNAGYKKQEIEVSARALLAKQSQQASSTQPPVVPAEKIPPSPGLKKPTEIEPPKKQELIKPTKIRIPRPEEQVGEPVSKQAAQKVSVYEQSPYFGKAEKAIRSAMKELQKVDFPDGIKQKKYTPKGPKRRARVKKSPKPKVVRRVSAYGKKPKKLKRRVLILLIVILIVLIGSLAIELLANVFQTDLGDFLSTFLDKLKF